MNIVKYPEQDSGRAHIQKDKWKATLYRWGYITIDNGIFIDFPIKQYDGRVYYDYPYQVPKYAKKLVEELFKLKEDNRV